MSRWLLVGAAFLAGLLYLLLVAGSKDEEALSTRAVPQHSDSATETDSPMPDREPALAAPLRMRSSESSHDAGAAPVAVQRAERSLATAFAEDLPSDEPIVTGRVTMIRELVKELSAQKLGAAQIHKLECKARHCFVELGHEDQEQLIKLVDALQDDRGFLGKAESMMLSRQGEHIGLYLAFPAEPGGEVLPRATR